MVLFNVPHIRSGWLAGCYSVAGRKVLLSDTVTTRPPLPRGALWYLRCMYTWSMNESGIIISLDGEIVMDIGWEEIWAAEDSIVGEWNE